MGIAAYNRGSLAISQQIDQEMKGRTVRICVSHPIAEPEAAPQKPLIGYWPLTQDPVLVAVGDRVFCTVSQCRGWSTVTEVKGSRRDLRIKTDTTGRTWAYGHNFTREPADWMLK
jgi:hypothetical protein